MRLHQMVSEVEVDGLIAESRRGIDIAELLHMLRLVAGLFRKLSGRTGIGVFSPIELAGRDLQKRLLDRIAVLTDEEDLSIPGDRDDSRCPRMQDDFSCGLVTMDLYLIIKDVQHTSFEGRRAIDQLLFFYAHFTPVLPTPPVRTPSAWSSSVVRYFVKIPCATRSPLFTWNGSSFVL